MADPADKKTCLRPGCTNKPSTRSLCSSCYRVAKELVEQKKTTWETLVEQGKATARGQVNRARVVTWLLENNKKP